MSRMTTPSLFATASPGESLQYQNSRGASQYQPRSWPVEAPTELMLKILDEIRQFPPGKTSMTWENVARKVDSFSLLQDDWDGDGSRAPTINVIDSAYLFVQELASLGAPVPKRVFVGTQNSVILEWRANDDLNELEITDTEMSLFCYCDHYKD